MRRNNPLLENKSFLYKIYYYLSPTFLIVLFVVLWQVVATSCMGMRTKTWTKIKV